MLGTTLEEHARSLTLYQPSLTFYQAYDLLLAAYKRMEHAKPYGNLLATCMKIEYSILMRMTEDELLARLSRQPK